MKYVDEFRDPEAAKKLLRAIEAQGSLPFHASPAAFQARIDADPTLWAPILEKLNLRSD